MTERSKPSLSSTEAEDIARDIVWHIDLDEHDRIKGRFARSYAEIEKRIVDLIKSLRNA